ncbi:MAG: site-specific DNA-methyltransferase [Sarcina sp.]
MHSTVINDLIRQIEDLPLKECIEHEIININKEKKFGLVFERHSPEATPIYDMKIKKGSTVYLKGKQIEEIWTVIEIRNDKAICYNRLTEGISEFKIEDLVVIAQFGDVIYPTLTPMDKVKNSDNDLVWHTLIEADNYHALQLLEYLHPKQVDCIYIDPPYNTGARDWKYNNNYVDINDNWRHSKWLAFMERRLKLAKNLLNPEESVLIIAIDDNELFTLGLLLDEMFKGTERQIINMTINPKGKARDGRLSQVDEYLIVIYIGKAKADELNSEKSSEEIRWPYLRRSDIESARGTKKGGVRQFYPIYVDENTEKIVSIGEPLALDQDLDIVDKIEGAIAVFPIKEDGKHMNWGLTGPSLQKALDEGYVRVMKSTNTHQRYNFSYITRPSIEKIERGIYTIAGKREDGTKMVIIPEGKRKKATTVWNKNLYDANAYGTQVLGEFVKEKKFPFPKSIYSVSDILRVFVGNKKDALIVDFFAGSGTTLNAINLLNTEDNGKRRCILITNNEVSEDEAKDMRKKGYKPGDVDWERNGICQAVTWPRTKASIIGKRSDGSKISGEYYTNIIEEKRKKRMFYQLSFTSNDILDTAVKKKQLIAMLGKEKLPQSLVKADSKYIISAKHTTSILFDEEYSDEWIDLLQENNQVVEFYIITSKNNVFQNIKKRIEELLGDIIINEVKKINMSDGFKSNCEYFKLDFLDKSKVELGKQFREILPMLWLKAGAIGERPEIKGGQLPDILIPKNSNFTVLIDEKYFSKLKVLLQNRNAIEYIYI